MILRHKHVLERSAHCLRQCKKDEQMAVVDEYVGTVYR